MLAADYLDAIREVLARIEQTQLDSIDRAAELVAESALAGGVWHLHDTGHLVSQELVHRAGGLMLVAPLTYSFGVNNPVRTSERRKAGQTIRGDRLAGRQRAGVLFMLFQKAPALDGHLAVGFDHAALLVDPLFAHHVFQGREYGPRQLFLQDLLFCLAHGLSSPLCRASCARI